MNLMNKTILTHLISGTLQGKEAGWKGAVFGHFAQPLRVLSQCHRFARHRTKKGAFPSCFFALSSYLFPLAIILPNPYPPLIIFHIPSPHLRFPTIVVQTSSSSLSSSFSPLFTTFFPRPIKNGVKKFTEWSVKQRTLSVMYKRPFMRWYKQLPLPGPSLFVVA